MKEIYLIRHAESIANAGHRTHSHDTIPLSEKGEEQARLLAENLTVVPDLIIVSPFLRTQQTAKHVIAKYPDTPVETWDVQEFTYLDPSRYNGTTAPERFLPVHEYWQTASIHHKETEVAESFAEFTERLRAFLERIEQRREKTILVFTHGRFIFGMRQFLEKITSLKRRTLDEKELRELMDVHSQLHTDIVAGGTFPIDNISIHKIDIPQEK